MKIALAIGLSLLLAACSAAPPPDAAPGCNPLVGDDCLTPYPSSFYEIDDATSATGVRLHLGDTTLPIAANGMTLKPDRLNAKDGFSPATPFIVYFKAGVDPTQLPTVDQLALSTSPTSPVQVIDFATGARVPVMAELDANAAPGDRQGLLIHPMTRLKSSTRYIVALVNLRDASGKPLVPAPFKALRDRAPLSKSLTPLQSRFEDIFKALQSAGVERSQLSLAWDVTTGSDQEATSHLTQMVDDSIAMLDGNQLNYTITKVVDTPNDPHLLREIQATIQVPWYLADMSEHSMMNFDSSGKPKSIGLADVPILIHIPQCAVNAAAPLPVVTFGHGLFMNAQQFLDAPELEAASDELCAVGMATDWIGLSATDLPVIAQFLASDLNNVYIVTDRLQQAHVNAQIMTRMMLTQFKNDPAMALNGKPVTDGSQVYYYGISNGGIQGGTFMALSKDIVRGVLNVPGCEWSLLIYRSTDFNQLKPLLNSSYPDPLDAQVIILASQSEWDYTDPATFAPHLLQSPLAGRVTKRILVQESIGDAQVTNIATRVLVRTIGLPGLDLETPIFGVTQLSAPLDSAYTQWDSHPNPLPPTTNTALTSDNGAHDSVYRQPDALAQVKAFLTPTGQVQQTCQGPCSFSQ